MSAGSTSRRSKRCAANTQHTCASASNADESQPANHPDRGIEGGDVGRQPQPMTTDNRTTAQADPAEIMQVGMGFWASKTLLSAVELELFTALGGDAMTAAEIAEALELHERAVPDFPDALVALRLLDREGDGSAAVYRNTDAGE